MKLVIDIVMKRIYLFNIVAWNYRKKIGFPICKKENFAGLQAHRKRGKSARASPTPHQTLKEERSARFTAQHLSALVPIGGHVRDLLSPTAISLYFANLSWLNSILCCWLVTRNPIWGGRRPWVHHAIWYISLTSTAWLRRETSQFDVLWRTWTWEDEFSKIVKISTLGKVACIWHVERVYIDEIKFERTQIHQ